MPLIFFLFRKGFDVSLRKSPARWAAVQRERGFLLLALHKRVSLKIITYTKRAQSWRVVREGGGELLQLECFPPLTSII